MSKNNLKIFESPICSGYPIIDKTDIWPGIEQSEDVFHVVNKNILIVFDKKLRSRIYAMFDNEVIMIGDYSYSHYPFLDGEKVIDFLPEHIECWSIIDNLGNGRRYVITAKSNYIKKDIYITVYDMFPSTAFFKVTYTNIKQSVININGWTNNSYSIASDCKPNNDILFWSYQSGSYKERPDWVIPLKQGFKQDNYMGMNASDYGGGTPVIDVWRKDIGMALGHVECKPKLVSLPVYVDDSKNAFLEINYKKDMKLEPGESITTFDTFVTVHKGDYFNALLEYRKIMLQKGVKFESITEEAYEPTWCAWGYERNFRVEQIYGALPMVKKLGFNWACIDDGWQTEEGDYDLAVEKFPNGDSDMRKLVDTIHSYGLKAQLWWIPLAIDPKSKLYNDHHEYLLINENGKSPEITWWDSFYMCPAYEEVREHTKEALKKILIDWGFDGLKIDGQHLNAAPPCFNPDHHHTYPEQSYEAIPEFFKMVYDLTREIKPDAIVMFCPCGTGYSFFTMPYYNEPVASDPESSWQVRTKGKAFKALMGRSAAFHGDHVELSDCENDFASTVGIGGVIDTKFTWPEGSAPVSVLKPESTYDLNKVKEEIWSKWLKIYRSKMLSKGEYMGELYTIGYDYPEAHAIKKGHKMYYAFFSEHWNGEIEIRGLESKEYTVYDYVNNIFLENIKGPNAKICVSFDRHILIEVSPV